MTKKPNVPEKTVQLQCEQLLDFNHWTWFHPMTGITFKGAYRTLYTGHKGFPDIVAVRAVPIEQEKVGQPPTPGRILFIECKSSKTRGATLDETQQEWRHEIEQAGIEYYLVGPDDVEGMTDVLA